ncbi:MAG: hypothetical protein FJ147_02885 [Deltaproteobacteria bacterium]|nr:hypothetical protein [Deltaproteobacteria bacterium]
MITKKGLPFGNKFIFECITLGEYAIKSTSLRFHISRGVGII